MVLAFAVGGGGEEPFATERGLVVCVKFASFALAISGQFQVASRQVHASQYPRAVAPGATTRAPIA